MGFFFKNILGGAFGNLYKRILPEDTKTRQGVEFMSWQSAVFRDKTSGELAQVRIASNFPNTLFSKGWNSLTARSVEERVYRLVTAFCEI